MIKYKTNKTQAQKLIDALKLMGLVEVATITNSDDNLYKLKLSQDIPCTLEININDIQIEELLDRLEELELQARVDNDRQSELLYQKVECLQSLLYSAE